MPKLKTVEIEDNTYAELKDGKPVYTKDDGSEVTFDYNNMSVILQERIDKNSKLKSKNEELEKQIKSFEGIEDPEAAIKALETVKNIDAKDLIEAGKVEEIKAAAIRSVEEKYKPFEEQVSTLQSELYNEKIGNKFASSQFISEKMSIPLDFVKSGFNQYFSIEEGNVIAKDASGNVIYSDEDPGTPANFDEAMKKLVYASPHRDHLLKGAGSTGTGAPGSTGSTKSSGKTITREEFGKLDHSARADLMSKGEVRVVD